MSTRSEHHSSESSSIRGGSQNLQGRRDLGAVLIWFAAAAVGLLGMGALVIDVGALWSERRQLQNGADAAALAVAQDCAKGSCGNYQSMAQQYADLNASDRTSDVLSVCGSPSPLVTCPPPPGAEHAVGFVKVTTGTRTTQGTDQIKYLMAPVLDSANVGRKVTASAAVAWGSPGGTGIMPFVISKCALEAFKVNGVHTFTNSLVKVFLHDASKSVAGQTCSYDGATWPAGFGYTGSPSTGCDYEMVSLNPTPANGQQTGTIQGENNGNSVSNDCATSIMAYASANPPKPIIVPVMYYRSGTGSNTIWSIDGFVAVRVCAFSMKVNSALPEFISSSPDCAGAGALCSVSGEKEARICGFFTPYTVTEGELGNSTDYGTRIIKMIQ